MKKQIQDCTAQELVDHFKLKSPFFVLSLSDRGATLIQGGVAIAFKLTDHINIKEPTETPETTEPVEKA